MVDRTDRTIPYESFGDVTPPGTIHIWKYPHDKTLIGVQVSTGHGLFEGTFKSWKTAWREANAKAQEVLRT
jgi:hypothetical protein